jgi:predicted dehydrogenase
LKVGVVGAGGVAQIEHIPNLLRLPEHFVLAGVADPSATARSFIARRYGVQTFADPADLLATDLDAVVIASPDALHYTHVAAALDAGLHVFCEKPLCYAPDDITSLTRRRDEAGRVLQTGYMKRFDPSYEALLGRLADQEGALLQVSVEVIDPDAAPFVRHHDWQTAADLPPGSGSALRAQQAEQVARAVPVPLDEIGFRGFCSAYASSIVHDVNAVHGILDALGVTTDGVTGASFYAGGMGGHGAVSLDRGAALWTMSHLTVPGLPHYSERITLVFEGSSLELEFPSPWLNHAPTRLTERRGRGPSLETLDVRVGYEEAFVEELKGFHSAITKGEPVRNTAEAARRDMELLSAMAAWCMTNTGGTEGLKG